MRAEYSAFRARLESNAKLAGKVDSSVRLTTTGEAVRANYVIAYPAAPSDMDDGRFTALQRADSGRDFEYDVRYVAVDADGVLVLAEAAHEQLIAHSLTVAGRSCTPLRLVPGGDARRVEFDRTARVYYMDESFRFSSRRA